MVLSIVTRKLAVDAGTKTIELGGGLYRRHAVVESSDDSIVLAVVGERGS